MRSSSCQTANVNLYAKQPKLEDRTQATSVRVCQSHVCCRYCLQSRASKPRGGCCLGAPALDRSPLRRATRDQRTYMGAGLPEESEHRWPCKTYHGLAR